MDTTLVCGFLEAGKTSYIQDSIQHDFFHKYGTTLVLSFESGETVYDEAALAEKRTSVAYYEGGEDITAFCIEQLSRFRPDRVFVEMNAMIPQLRSLLPGELTVRFVITLIDFTTLSPYLTNLRQHLVDMVRMSDTVTFLHCGSSEALAPYAQAFRVMNPKASYLRQDPMGYHEKAFGLFLPYSLEAPVIEIDDAAFIPFFLDTLEHPEHYQDRSLHFKLPLEVQSGEGRELRCGRTVMTCCMADLQFMSAVLLPGPEPSRAGSWIALHARGQVLSGPFGQKRLGLIPERLAPAAPPKELILRAL